MKRKLIALIQIMALLIGCSAIALAESQDLITVTDSASKTVAVQARPQTVYALSSSFAEIWLLSGGALSGVTDDALTDRDFGLPEEIVVLGTVKDPNIDLILSGKPDLVILSQDIAAHISIAEILQDANIPHYIAKTETLADYLEVLGDFASITGNQDSLYTNGERVQDEVEALLSKLPSDAQGVQKTALFLRALSSDVKVKARDHTVCYILDDIGVQNIADREGFPLEELSVEAILEADPDYIFIVAMGDEDAARTYLEQSLFVNPAWGSLSAVKNGNLIMLPKSLYHYKPNNRWGEAYETLLKIIYPEVYGGD